MGSCSSISTASPRDTSRPLSESVDTDALFRGGHGHGHSELLDTGDTKPRSSSTIVIDSYTDTRDGVRAKSDCAHSSQSSALSSDFPIHSNRVRLPPIAASPAPGSTRIARYDGSDDSDSDSECDEQNAQMEEITEEEICGSIAALDDTLSHLHHANGADALEARRASLLAASPLRIPSFFTASHISDSDSTKKSLSFSLPLPPFHVLLIDEDTPHAASIAGWLRHKRCIVTLCGDGAEAESVCHAMMCHRQKQIRRAELDELTNQLNNIEEAEGSESEHEQEERAHASEDGERREDDDDDEEEISPPPSFRLDEIDLIVCDSSTESSDGSPFLDFCKQTLWLSEIPVCLMSVDAESAAIDRTIRRGAHDHFRKPVPRPVMQAAIKQLKEARNQARKAILLREWGDRYKELMMAERKASIVSGMNPLTLTSTPLTNQRSSLMGTPQLATRSTSIFQSITLGSVASAAAVASATAGSAEYHALLVSASDSTQMNKIESWIATKSYLTHTRVDSLNEARSMLPRPKLRRAISISPKASGSQSPRHGFATAKSADILILDTESFTGAADAVRQLCQAAIPSECSLIVLAADLPALSLAPDSELTTVLQTPLGRDAFLVRLTSVIQRRQSREQTAVLEARVENYKRMLDKIREKRSAELVNGHARVPTDEDGVARARGSSLPDNHASGGTPHSLNVPRAHPDKLSVTASSYAPTLLATNRAQTQPSLIIASAATALKYDEPEEKQQTTATATEPIADASTEPPPVTRAQRASLISIKLQTLDPFIRTTLAAATVIP